MNGNSILILTLVLFAIWLNSSGRLDQVIEVLKMPNQNPTYQNPITQNLNNLGALHNFLQELGAP